MPTLTERSLGRHHKATRSASRKINQLIEIQQLLIKDIKDEKTMPHHRAACARAWEVLEERARILMGKPLPGQLRPDLEQRRRKVGSLSALKLSPPVPMSDLPTTDDQKTSAG